MGNVLKLIAIYNVWDGEELLEGSIRQIREHVDFVLCVVQIGSNWGEHYSGGLEEARRLQGFGLVDSIRFVNTGYLPPQAKETQKRQLGIDYAIENGFTHFLHMDCDEYYNSTQFAQAKKQLEYESIDGSVCKIQTYYKSPLLKFHKLDDYYVPFIHRVKPETKCGLKAARDYPFYADPTRRIAPVRGVVEFDPGRIVMHHYSYVRRDIERKLRNSTARKNIFNGTVLADYRNAKAGMAIESYGKGMRLVEAKDIFNIKWDENEATEAEMEIRNTV